MSTPNQTVQRLPSPRLWAHSTLNHRFLRRFGSISARAGLLSSLIALFLGAVLAVFAVGILYFALHSSIQQNLQNRLEEVLAGSPSAQDLTYRVQETGAGIDMVALFDSDQLVRSTVSAGSPDFPADLHQQIKDDGASHTVDGVRANGLEFHALGQVVNLDGGRYTLLVGIESNKDRDLYLLFVISLGLLVPLFALLSGWLTFRSVRSSITPVERIRAEVENISSSELSRRVPVPATGDEISALASTMNSMLNRLDEAQRTQLRFLGDASHELRSPIASISGLVEIAQLTDEPIDVDSVKSILAPEAARMQRLVDDLLASASAQDRSAPREDVDLDDLILAEQKRLRLLYPALTIEGAVEPVRVVGIEEALTRALRNLTDNASKYCRSRIKLSISSEGDQAIIRVEDDGEGVPDSAKELILRRFGRTDYSRTRATGGAGLGLSIVGDIVTAHDGSLQVEDSPLGGARFTLLLPLSA